ncbi:fructosamine kinase family protein [Nicoliella spurrieriana]|uniref:Fructosamine kinase family protein n=1 Tax=Nicoliella spurrieriana TaxID=2925830 RepID=A0A976RRK0_9LACO|nr:fructosamine kinase family protein [Nicoliella spurrieriana]UQS86527.1 fructosamine kinase family protein [Nicoliella spurrieriana]
MYHLTSDWLAQLPVANINHFEPVSGGDINESYAISDGTHKYFMKVQPGRGKQFFAHEVEGLKLLSQAANTPEVVAFGEINGDGYLILKWLDQSSGSQFELGQMLARVHQIHRDQFGLDHDFTVGKIPKHNQWQSKWQTFYVEQRLKPLIELAKQKQRWNKNRSQHMSNMIEQINEYYANQPVTPSLLHGDLWSGNFTFSNGKPYLIDPDVFFGNREFDIAVTTVFGGFSQEFYSGYNSIYPLKKGVEKRLGWYRSYYLLVHLVLFGETYGPALDNVLEPF